MSCVFRHCRSSIQLIKSSYKKDPKYGFSGGITTSLVCRVGTVSRRMMDVGGAESIGGILDGKRGGPSPAANFAIPEPHCKNLLGR